MESVTIYVELLNEGTPTWRPTQAYSLGSSAFKLLPTPDYDPGTEEWAFLPGDHVICEERTFEEYGGKEVKRLAAVSKV